MYNTMEDTYLMRLSRKCYYVCLGLVAAMVLFLLALKLLQIPITELDDSPCVWITYFGIYCPGCGGTRAVESLCEGEVLQSFMYHPVVLYTVVVVGVFVASHTLHILTKGKTKVMLFRPVYLYIMVAIILVQCIVKNVLKFVFLIELC